ncbi:MAG: hypothetical protein AB1847_07490 [bacterium]
MRWMQITDGQALVQVADALDAGSRWPDAGCWWLGAGDWCWMQNAKYRSPQIRVRLTLSFSRTPLRKSPPNVVLSGACPEQALSGEIRIQVFQGLGGF